MQQATAKMRPARQKFATMRPLTLGLAITTI
jgi:hypothetical protein